VEALTDPGVTTVAGLGVALPECGLDTDVGLPTA
jgi:hypothetical protein